MPLHADELHVDTDLVRRLVDRDLPQVRHAPLRRLADSGSSNVLFRLGDHLLVRLPRQPGGSATIRKEAQWLPAVAASLPVEVPRVVAVGDPGFGYPESWSVSRWIAGTAPAVPYAHGGAGEQVARDLGDVVRALRAVPVPPDALSDTRLRWYRGGALRAIADDIRGYLDDCRSLPGLDLDLDACAAVWEAALALPEPAGGTAARWLHGDLLAENLLLRDGRLAAVLDFGGLAVGDPTVDLVVAWEVLERSSRAVFRAQVDVDEATWLRGRAWALAIAVMTFPYYGTTMPARCAARLVMARAAIADAVEDGTA